MGVSTRGPDTSTASTSRSVRLQGVRRPSLREITHAAGHRNASAVAYHFVDRQGLLDAVWQRRTQLTNAQRSQRMSEIERAGRVGDLRALVEAHVLLTLLDHLREAVARDHPEPAPLRVALSVRFVIAGLAAWERDIEAGRCTQDGLPGYADDIVGALLAAP